MHISIRSLKSISRRALALITLAGGLHTGADAVGLLTNGDFESWSGKQPEAWTIPQGTGVEATHSSAEGREGGRSLLLECSTYERINRNSSILLEQQTGAPIEKAKWYRLSGWLRAEGLKSGLLRAMLVNAKSRANAGLYLEIPVAAEWQRFEKTFQALDAAEAGLLQFWFEETGSLWLDDLELTEAEGPARAYTDLNTPGESANLLPNASFEGGAYNWSSQGTPTGWGGDLSSLFGTLDNASSVDGQTSLRIDLTTVTLPTTHFDIWPSTRTLQRAPLATSLGWMRVREGEPVTLSAWMRAAEEGTPARLKISFGKPDSGPTRQEQRVELTKEWRRYSLTCPAEAGFAYVSVGCDLNGTTQATATVWIDAVQFEQSAEASPFTPRSQREFALTSAAFGNVFDGPATPTLQLALDNRGADQALRLELELTDYFDRPLPTQTIEIEASSGTLVTQAIELKLPGRGYYKAQLHDAADATRRPLLQRPLALAWIDGYRGSDSAFGINHVPTTHELAAQLRRAGLLWGRDWSINWEHLEPVEGQLDFSTADIQVDRMLADQLHPLCLLPPFPSANWASSISPEALKAAPSWSEHWIEMAYAPRDPAQLAEFIRKAAQHFKSRVATWEFLNEPFYTLHALPALDQIDESIADLPGADYTVHEYIDLLKLARNVTKEVNPQARLIGGISGRPDLLTREFIAEGGLQHVDILNLHIYPGLRKPEYYIEPMRKLRSEMQTAGEAKPIWITEYGYYGLEQAPWEPYQLGPWEWAGNRLLADERQAADFSIRFAAIMMAHGVEKIFYHSGMGVSSTINSHAANESWMTSYGGVPRKLYPAQAALAQFTGANHRFAGELKSPATAKPVQDAHFVGYAFDVDNGALAILWALEEPIEVQIAPGVSVWDIMGNPITERIITLGQTPYYLTSGDLTGAALADAWQP